ncbi:MAG: polysaccharide deacetylase family protein, partial [Ferruginibacter sp.]
MGKSLVLVFHKESNGPLFEKIIVALKTRYRLVSIHELEQLLSEKKELKNVCHISFDDGHRSFYDVIFPILRKHHVPVSLFISPDVISTNSNYWFQEVHDYDEKIVKEILSTHLNISPGKISRTPFKMIFKTLSIQEIEKVMDIYQQQTKCGIKAPKNINLEQLQELALSDLVTIGAHSLKHPILKNENDADCNHEITASIKKLEMLTGKPVKYFAFPNGMPGLDYGEREINYLRDNNISMAFSTELDTLS